MKRKGPLGFQFDLKRDTTDDLDGCSMYVASWSQGQTAREAARRQQAASRTIDWRATRYDIYPTLAR